MNKTMIKILSLGFLLLGWAVFGSRLSMDKNQPLPELKAQLPKDEVVKSEDVVFRSDLSEEKKLEFLRKELSVLREEMNRSDMASELNEPSTSKARRQEILSTLKKYATKLQQVAQLNKALMDREEI